MAKFAACNAGTEIEVTDTDGVVLYCICKVIIALCHGSNENGYAFVFVQALDVVAHSYNLRLEAECYLATIGG